MKSIRISLEMTKKVTDFVMITQDYPDEILVKSGKYVVDGKSLLGLFSLDLSNPVTVEIYSSDCEKLLNDLKRFEV
jgi:phosphotransferase system HPr-like phosphotransfer protein